MSDTCIVCLGDLSLGIDGVAEQSTGAVAKSPTADAAAAAAAAATLSAVVDEPANDNVDTTNNTTAPELVAHLQPCGHDLHDACLKPWVERANSCPICRASFHLVEQMHYVGGPVVDSYAVQDKTQVAEVDPSLFLENPDEYDDDEVCQVCGEGDNEDILMYCDGCGKLWHTYCTGLDEVPYASWFCDSCASERATDPLQRHNSRRTYGPVGRRRTRGMERRRRNYHANQDDGWNQVWQSVWSLLSLDLDFPYDDEETSATLMRRHRQAVEEDRRQHQAFEARARIAELTGAGSHFRAARTTLLNGDSNARAAGTHAPPQETAEEIAAWNALAEATGENDEPEPSSPRKRKRKSRPSSPAQCQPSTSPRETKRRRTSTPPAPLPQPRRRPRPTARRSPSPRTSPRSRPRTVVDTAGPSFLQSLLQEVEGSAGPSGPSLHRPLPRNPASPPAEQISPRPSSPATSNPSSPRALSATPPPIMNGFRPSSPPGLSSSIQPVYPQAGFSPGPSSSPERPEKSPEPPPQQNKPRVPAAAASNLARPTPRRPRIPTAASPSRTRSHNTSPSRTNLSASNKADVQKLVSAALKPHYHEQKISKDEYTTINRDVSRMLYEKIGDFEALDLEGKAKWAEIAGEEVNKAVTALKA